MIRKYNTGLICMLVSIIIFLFSKDFFLFWDAIQFAGKHPLFYYDHSFNEFFLPSEIDSGHFPFFGMYIAAAWMILGKSLWASHLAMVPFIFLSLHMSYSLGKRWAGSPEKAILFPALLLLIPQCITQFCLISPDVILVTAFIGLLLGFEKGDKRLVLLFSLIAILISNRGIIFISAIGIWSLWLDRRPLFGLKLYLFPSVVIFLAFQFAHWLHSGWSGFGDDMSWSESFGFVSISGYIKNEVVFIWRQLDYGMIAIWCVLFYCLYRNDRDFYSDRYILLLIILLALLEVVTVPFVGLMQHRYFLPISILSGFLSIRYLLELKIRKRTKAYILSLTTVILVSGHFWIYPDKIAQGWDSTLAHQPYYDLYTQMLREMDQLEITYDQVGTGFPMRSPHHELFLNKSQQQLAAKDIQKQAFILWSNISNDFSDDEIDELSNEWEELVSLQRRGVKMKLYHNIKAQ